MDRRSKIFIAWSKETEALAAQLAEYLEQRGLSIWLSQKIEPGAKFREEIRRNVLGSHIVLAVFPENPSPWQIAEAGLAYFDNKLIPVAINTDQVIEPFSELETFNLNPDDFESEDGESLNRLVDRIVARIGDDGGGDINFRILNYANNLFFRGLPLIGVICVCVLFVLAFRNEDDFVTLEMWKTGHILFGAIIYGGGAFIALTFARAGTSTSFSQRRFGFYTARILFFTWFFVAVLQFGAGAYLWNVSGLPIGTHWLVVSAMIYPFALICAFGGYHCYSTAYSWDSDQRPLRDVHLMLFAGNGLFGMMIIIFTIVILLMGLKEETMPS